MKPTCRAVLDLLQRAQGHWVGNDVLYTVGGKRTSGRIDELRAEKWEIEKRHHAGQWQYRLVNPPPSPYEHFSCVCGWQGDEPQAMRRLGGYMCPSCGRSVEQTKKVAQVALLP